MARRREDRAGGNRPAGLSLLIPGYPQWAWGQRERSAALGGTFATAVSVALFAWGSRLGLAMVALAFVAHVSSASDAIRQSAFPGFGRWVPTISSSFGLGLGCYVPVLAAASWIAWPGMPQGAETESYAINRWAYQGTEPKTGDWVWYRSPDGPGCGFGRVVAGPGREVEWSSDGLRVDGQRLRWTPDASGGIPRDLMMMVPEGRLLVAPARLRPVDGSPALRLLGREAVIGRPWARLYPVWRRRFLF